MLCIVLQCSAKMSPVFQTILEQTLVSSIFLSQDIRGEKINYVKCRYYFNNFLRSCEFKIMCKDFGFLDFFQVSQKMLFLYLFKCFIAICCNHFDCG